MSTDFSSIDRLVEFGLGISLAQQMVSTMNHTLNSALVAGVNGGTTGQQSMASACINKWYAAIDGKQAGPLSDSELRQLVSRHLITEQTLMWCPGMPAWKFAADIPPVNKLLLLN